MATHKFENVAKLDSGDGIGIARKKGNILDTLEASGVLALNDVVIVGRVPVDGKLPSLKLFCDDLGTAGTVNIGFHKISGKNDLGAAIDADALATAVDVNAAALAGVDQAFEVRDIATLADKMWELAGLSARPAFDEMFLTMTIAEATTAGGTIGVHGIIE